MLILDEVLFVFVLVGLYTPHIRPSIFCLLGHYILLQVSMIQASFLDWLDSTVRDIRDNETFPFGGIQLIFAGDFCQLHGMTGCP